MAMQTYNDLLGIAKIDQIALADVVRQSLLQYISYRNHDEKEQPRLLL